MDATGIHSHEMVKVEHLGCRVCSKHWGRCNSKLSGRPPGGSSKGWQHLRGRWILQLPGGALLIRGPAPWQH